MEQREDLDTEINGVRIFENHEVGRLQLYFEGNYAKGEGFVVIAREI